MGDSGRQPHRPTAPGDGDAWYPAASAVAGRTADDEDPDAKAFGCDHQSVGSTLVQKQLSVDPGRPSRTNQPRSRAAAQHPIRPYSTTEPAFDLPSGPGQRYDEGQWVTVRAPSPPRVHGGQAAGSVVRRSPVGHAASVNASTWPSKTPESNATGADGGRPSALRAPASAMFSFAGRVDASSTKEEFNAGAVEHTTLSTARLAEDNVRLRETVTRLADGVTRAQRAAVTVAAAASAAIASSSAHGHSAGSAHSAFGAASAEVVPVPAGALRALVLATDEKWCSDFVATDAIGLISQAVNARRRLRKLRARIGWASMCDAVLLKSRVSKAHAHRRSILGAIASGAATAQADEAVAHIMQEPMPGRAGVSQAKVEAEPARRYITAAEAGAVATRWLSRRAVSLLHAAELQRAYLRGRANAADATARAAIGVALFSAAASAMLAIPTDGASFSAAPKSSSARSSDGTALPLIQRCIAGTSESPRGAGSRIGRRPPYLRTSAALEADAATSAEGKAADGAIGTLAPTCRAAMWLCVPSASSRQAGELPRRAGAAAVSAVSAAGSKRGGGTFGASHALSSSSFVPALATDTDPRRKAIVGAAGIGMQDALAHAASVIAPTIAERALVVIARQWQPAKTPIKLAQQARDIRDRLLAAADAVAMMGAMKGSERQRLATKAAQSAMMRPTGSRAEDAARWRMLARRHSAAELLELLVFALTGVCVPLV